MNNDKEDNLNTDNSNPPAELPSAAESEGVVKTKAIESLLGFLQAPTASSNDSIVTTPPLDSKALLDDLDVSKVALGLQDDKITKKLLKVYDNEGIKTKQIDRLSVDTFFEIYNRMLDLTDKLTKDEQGTLLEFISKKIVKLARNDFYIYVKFMAPEILPEGFKDGKHIKLMCESLQGVEKGTADNKPKRQMIFCPPGAMKSKLINLFISWCLGRHPKWNILHIGHGTQFVEDNAGRPIRDLMRTENYLKVFPHVRIKQDSRAAGRWELSVGGKYYGAGVGTQIAGRRAHISICDDVVSEQTAYSIVERRGINAWYVPGLRTRLLPNGSEIIVNTRWHTEDLSGYLENNDNKGKRPWDIIKIPAILDAKSAKLLGLPEGGSFWPEFQPLEFLLDRMNDPGMSPAKASALYMQEPIPEEGAIFKETDFQIWESKKPPAIDLVILSLDTAYSIKTSADFSAYSVWGVFQTKSVDTKGREHWLPNLILIEADKKRWAYTDLVEQVKEMNDYYKPDIILVENKSSGQSLIPELRLMGFPVMEFNPDKFGDKVARANQVTPYFRNGRVWVPDSQNFSSTLIKDALEFPFGSSDDLVDTMTQCLIHLRNSAALSTQDHTSEDLEDEDDMYHKRRKTYWSVASSNT